MQITAHLDCHCYAPDNSKPTIQKLPLLPSRQFQQLKKMLLIMRLTSIILLIFCLKVSAGGYAQQITLKVKNVSCETIFKEITRQSGYHFFYNKKLVRNAPNVSVDLKAVPVEKAMEICFANQPFDFAIVNTTVVLRMKEETDPATSAVPEKAPKVVIKGTITDDQGNVLPGATIAVKGTDQRTVANDMGEYSIEANPGDKLEVSFIGFETQEIVVSKQTNISITLKVTGAGLNEVVVVGYGTQKKASVTGAITSIKSDDVKNIPIPNLSSALAGRLSGVTVNQNSGAPGYAPSIRVRSVNTWKSTGNDPLYVIDGVISDKRLFDAMDYTEVENVTVLKDAASGAVYGARAANGVILVTTKRGSSGKVQLNYSYSYSIDKPSKIPEYMDAKDMVRLNNYARTSRGITPMYDAEEVAFFNENDPSRAWYTLAYKDPVLQRHTVSATGGSDKVKYFLGGTYFDQTAFIKNADFKKYNFRSNLDVNFTKNLSGIFNVSYNQATRKRFAMQEDLVGFDVNPNFGGLWSRLLYNFADVPPKTSDGKFINPGWIGNPLAFVEEGGTNTRVERNVALLLGLNYKVPFVEGLSVSGKYSPNYVATTMKLHELKTTLYDVVRKGTNGAIYTDEIIGSFQSAYPNKERLAKVQEATNNYQLNFSANYVKKFGKHDIDAIVIYEQSEGNYDYFYGVRENFPLLQNSQFWATSAARADGYVNGSEREFGRASIIGRAVYSYDEKYYINATARRDGSMLFAPEYRWGTFPSLSAGWVLSKENFFRVKNIDFLKLRGSWGLTGNDAVGGWKWAESYGVTGDYVFGTTPMPRVTYNGIVNPRLTWEKTREVNLGLDARLFSNFLLSAEYFKRHNYNILDARIVSFPNSFGGSMPPENYGIVDAHGYELEFGYNAASGPFEYGIKGNFSYATNKVKLRDVAQNARDVDNPNGRPTDYLRMLVATGIMRTQKELDELPAGYTIYGRVPVLGAINFEDVSGLDGIPDGKIDDYDIQVLNGKRSINPYTFGLNLNGRWKGIGLEVFFQGVTGVSKLYNDGYGRRFFDGGRPPTFWLDSWTPDNVDAKYPQPVTWDFTADHLASTFWLKNSSFVRLQYINLSYALPKSICQKITLSGLNFFLSGTNLITLSSYKYHDPAVENMNAYPTMKTFTFGANVSF